MKRTVAVLGTLLGTLLMVAPPASAQVEAGGTVHVPGASPPPQYVLAADGTLTMGGNIVFNCNEFARAVEQYGDDPPSDPHLRSELEGASGVLEECERAGFSPSGGTGAGPIGPSGVEDAEGTPLGGITEDGFVRTQNDTFVACDSGFPVVEQYAEACENPGSTTVGQEPDRQQETLPETGGPSPVSPLAALLVVSGVLVAVVWRRTS